MRDVDIVNEARSRESRASLTSFGVDETACKHGQNYVSVFVDMAFRKVLFATAGKDTLTIKGFREDFKAGVELLNTQTNQNTPE